MTIKCKHGFYPGDAGGYCSCASINNNGGAGSSRGYDDTTNHPEGSLEEDIEGLIKRIEKYVNDNVEDRDFQRHWLKAHLEIFSRKERKQHGDKRYEEGVANSAKIVKTWHIKKGGLTELEYQIQALIPKDT